MLFNIEGEIEKQKNMLQDLKEITKKHGYNAGWRYYLKLNFWRSPTSYRHLNKAFNTEFNEKKRGDSASFKIPWNQ